MTVDRTWHLEKANLLVLRPDFSVPDGFPTQRIETVLVEPPGGVAFQVEAQFNLSHFNIRSPEPLLDLRWRITVSLLHTSPDRVPVGSRLFAEAELVAMLHGTKNAEPGATPNGGPAAPVDNSSATEGPPSVS